MTPEEHDHQYYHGHHRGCHGGNRCAGNPHLRKTPFAENQDVIPKHIHPLPRKLRQHEAHIVATSAEKTGNRHGDKLKDTARQHDLQVGSLLHRQSGIVPPQQKETPAEGRHEHADKPGQDTDVNALPDELSHLGFLAGADKIGNVGTGVAGNADDKAVHRVGNHRRSPHGSNGFLGIPRQKHPVHKLHQNQTGRCQNQGYRQKQYFRIFGGLKKKFARSRIKHIATKNKQKDDRNVIHPTIMQ